MATRTDQEQAQQILANSTIDYRALVESIRDYAIFMLDPQGLVISWNAGAQQINGYAADEIIGQDFRIFYSPQDQESGQPELELKTAQETGRYEDEVWRLRKGGHRYRAHVLVTALRVAQGELLGFVKITHDVTDRWEAEQELRQTEERFRILVEQILEYAIFLLSPDGRITSWNLGAKRIKGYEAADVVGQHISLFYTPEDVARGRWATLLQHARDTGAAYDTGWRLRKDGSRFWADATLTALRDANGNLYGYAKIVRDLTEQVEAEELAKAYQAAQEAVQARDEFLSIASHELRTPLAAMLLQLQVVKRQLAKIPADQNYALVAQGLERALSSGERLSKLLDTLLDVTRITMNRIELELSEFDPAVVVEEEVGRLSAIARAAGCELRLQVEPGIEVRWDRLRIEQALMNLVVNACKYAAGSPVEIGVQRHADKVRLWVQDQGPGIAADKIEQVFDRFVRTGSSDRASGLGLGLYVTRQIAEAHGGTANVDSRVGQGSRFNLVLPLQVPSPALLM